MTDRYERITASDGGEFDAFCAVPGSGSGPGVVLFQEIFGINDNMRGLAERLAEKGFVTLVPDMYEKEAADLAWERTLEFLGTHLGVRR
jgi:carboxymethylenebutenolidase